MLLYSVASAAADKKNKLNSARGALLRIPGICATEGCATLKP